MGNTIISSIIEESRTMSACKCAGIIDTLREIKHIKKHKMKSDQRFCLSFLEANSHIMFLDD